MSFNPSHPFSELLRKSHSEYKTLRFSLDSDGFMLTQARVVGIVVGERFLVVVKNLSRGKGSQEMFFGKLVP